MFCGFCCKTCVILTPQQGIRPTLPVLESQVLTTGPGKSLGYHFSNPERSRTGLMVGPWRQELSWMVLVCKDAPEALWPGSAVADCWIASRGDCGCSFLPCLQGLFAFHLVVLGTWVWALYRSPVLPCRSLPLSLGDYHVDWWLYNEGWVT